jgi:hypothetical protein
MRNRIAVLAFIVAAIALTPGGVAAESAPQTKETHSTEVRALVGRWVRTDAYYVIEIRPAKDGGALEVGYYNPNPINVGRAEFTDSVAGPVVTVELRDVNYPGSTYILTYDRTRDALIGTYFQAVQGTTFDVAFIRQK